ncbi:uncharacterized protein LOC141852951 isoform X2 [Brevipalpus obovatus]|uniref:uncharacterized protein LOC141852951 isoform X2 n=1 Tax=Brevipalpus obovatus TaxID=246614 RepID=UPI003D9E4969
MDIPESSSISSLNDMSGLTASLQEVSQKTTLNRITPVAWVVSATDKAKYDEIFVRLDTDMDGYVAGPDCKHTFLQTGVPQKVLAHIWELCDVRQTGRLNSEQFGLAMYFVNLYKTNHELPESLLPEMIPPTLRPKPLSGLESSLMNQSVSNGLRGTESVSTGNKEIDSLNEELRELQISKSKLETEVNQQEASIRLKQSLMKNHQNELETLHQMIKQLDNQKVEAKKRLEEMSNQVEILRKQVEEQKDRIELQETELNAKRKELEELKSEELQLQSKLSESRKVIEQLSSNLVNSQLQISQYKAKSVPLEEYEKQLRQTFEELELAIQNRDIHKLNSLIARPITPPVSEITDFNDNKEDLESGFFKNKDNEFMSLGNEFMSDPFAGEDPFTEDDPFKNEHLPGDNFGNAERNLGQTGSAFDPFNDNVFSRENDPFGDHSFSSTAVSRNSIPQSESPTPELPPKKSKVPPPRPIPPKQKTPPPRPAPPPTMGNTTSSDPWANAAPGFSSNDPFASSVQTTQTSSNFDNFGSNFADFANFDQVQIPKPVDPYASLASITRNSHQTTW